MSEWELALLPLLDCCGSGGGGGGAAAAVTAVSRSAACCVGGNARDLMWRMKLLARPAVRCGPLAPLRASAGGDGHDELPDMLLM